MSFSWTPHRFSGGALALDVANSVILRFDPARSMDRFAVPEQLAAFPAAAMEHGVERPKQGLHALPAARVSAFIELRERIDGHFRAEVSGKASAYSLADMLEAIASALRASGPGDLDFETAQSALRLTAQPERERMKICPNCEWLFIDRSRNRSRAWCDMAVCGNRVKARLHYRKKKGDQDS